MTNLQNKKAQIEMEIAKLQSELAEVNAQIVAEENTVTIEETSALEKLATKVEADANKFGVHIEEIVFNELEKDELALAEKAGYAVQNSITVVTFSGTLEVNQDGSADLFNTYGDFVKTYKKVGSAVKALGNMAV